MYVRDETKNKTGINYWSAQNNWKMNNYRPPTQGTFVKEGSLAGRARIIVGNQHRHRHVSWEIAIEMHFRQAENSCCSDIYSFHETKARISRLIITKLSTDKAASLAASAIAFLANYCTVQPLKKSKHFPPGVVLSHWKMGCTLCAQLAHARSWSEGRTSASCINRD